MDYSLLVGIHDCDLAAANGAGDQPRNNSFDNDIDDQDIDDDQEDEDSPGNGGVGVAGAGGAGTGGELTPPDSPVVLYQPPFFSGELDKSLEFFAVKCSERTYNATASIILLLLLLLLLSLLQPVSINIATTTTTTATVRQLSGIFCCPV